MEKFALLCDAVAHVHAGRSAQARPALETLQKLLGPEVQPQDAAYEFYRAALVNRVEEHGSPSETNLYRQDYDQPQIDLYYLLTTHLPFMDTSRVVNELLAGQVGTAEDFALMSVGIGHGRQESALLRGLATGNPGLRRCTVIGVDPDRESLATAERTLWQVAAEHGVELDFRPVAKVAEDLDDADWMGLSHIDVPLVVNASLALHHMQDPSPGHDARDEFFQRLRELNPCGLVLNEFDTDHHEVSFPQRFFNSWRFFGTILRAIEATPATQQEKDHMKTFFAREIMNIVGSRTDDQRFERHEPAATWITRLRRCGFEPYGDAPGLQAHPLPEDFTVRVLPEQVRLGYRGTTVCSVIGARPAG
ncbi:GRAS family protein [Lentzea sp. NPDC042327]|uniref:GRAS family protein n=1 Tax=Lentzea sp. NPDC042327 TaxID=3154801 RepID=UPI0033ED2229